MPEIYSVYSKFDMAKHKETFHHYLEVIIHPDGQVEYAVPSHQGKLIRIACEKLGVSRDELDAMCPPAYYCDYLAWLCAITECTAVWSDFYYCPNTGLTKEQLLKLKSMKMLGIYEGKIASNL